MQVLARKSLKGLASWACKAEIFSAPLKNSCHKRSLARSFAGASSNHSRGAQFNLKPKVCYYKVLNVSTAATELEIKQAYQKLVKRLHPDVNPGSEELFKEVIDAYGVLSDAGKKELYDTSIGIFDPDWGKADSHRFWTGDHKARMEEEIAKMKGAIFYPTAEQEKYFKGKLPQDKDKRLSDAEKTVYVEKKQQEQPEESHLMVNGKKHNTDELHAYFQAKYLKNPDIETVNPKEKLRFTKTDYNKVQERKQETKENTLYFNDLAGNFKVNKRAEDRIKSPVQTVMVKTAPLILVALLFVGMFTFTTQKPVKKNELSSKHISHGEGYVAKFAPT